MWLLINAGIKLIHVNKIMSVWGKIACLAVKIQEHLFHFEDEKFDEK